METRLPPREFGLSVEELFDVQCIERGLCVAVPLDWRTACDRIVVAQRKPLVVQIKSTRYHHMAHKGNGHKRLRYTAHNVRHDTKGTRFAANGVDVLVFFVEPLNRWHIFPASYFPGRWIHVSSNPTGRMRDAIENWELLR